ncbi:MAG TPA: TatD family hydrolase [Candidatus Polarisedimenticolaceae bacterium]
MIDTHCHLTHARFRDDVDAVIARARDAGLEGCVTIGTGVDDAARVVELSRRHPGFVVCTAGLDPFSSHAAGDAFDDHLARLAEGLRSGAYVAVGEVGLDYHYALDPRPIQAERFRRQLEIARDLDLPVVIHVRDAHEDLAAILKEHAGCRGVIHSFTAGIREAERYLELGWSLAFNGVVTFRNAEEVREAARACPSERLLFETDAPYLAPAPHRGERCEPAHLTATVHRVAQLRGEEPETLARTASANARALFRLR